MAEDLHAHVRRGRRIADDHVDGVGRELCDELIGVAFDAGDVHGVGAFGDGTQQAIHGQLRHGVRDADRELRHAARRPALQRFEQFAPGREDIVRVSIDDPADVGEDEPAALAREQALAERRFELADLRAHGGLRQSQPLGRARDAALARDRPEVVQVVIVEPVHRADSKNLCERSQVSICLCMAGPVSSGA